MPETSAFSDEDKDVIFKMMRVMADAFFDAKDEAAKRGEERYWKYVDANHRHLLAKAALKYMRSLDVEERMELLGMERVSDPHPHGHYWREKD